MSAHAIMLEPLSRSRVGQHHAQLLRSKAIPARRRAPSAKGDVGQPHSAITYLGDAVKSKVTD